MENKNTLQSPSQLCKDAALGTWVSTLCGSLKSCGPSSLLIGQCQPWLVGAPALSWSAACVLGAGRASERSPNQLPPSTPTTPNFFPSCTCLSALSCTALSFLRTSHDSIVLSPAHDLSIHALIEGFAAYSIVLSLPSLPIRFETPLLSRLTSPSTTRPACPFRVRQLNEFCFATYRRPIPTSKQKYRISNLPRSLQQQVNHPGSSIHLQLLSRVFYAGSLSFDIYPPQSPPTLQSTTFSALIL